jgi:hypothetical protein
MKPEEILRDARDMVKHYPNDRLRLTGAEILALVEYVTDWALEGAKARQRIKATLAKAKKAKRGAK